MKRQIADFFVEKDIYGQPVTVNYRGRDAFKTKLGAFCSIVTYALILFNTVQLCLQWVDGSKQEET